MDTKRRVLLADDEEFICVLLHKIICWEELNLELIGIVHDGVELYEAIVEKKPDIVVTDICMPQVDGIELIGRIRQENIACRFVIVSGYRQFEYAHDALKYDVEDYILKPVDETELNNTLRKICRKMQEQEKGTENGETPRQEENGRMKRFFLNRIIKELDETDSSFDEISEQYGIAFQPGIFQILRVKSDISGDVTDFFGNADSIQDKMEKIFYRLFEENCYHILVYKNNGEMQIGVNYAAGEFNTVNRKIGDYYEQIRNIVDLFKDYKITIGVGRPYGNLWEWKKSDLEAQYAIGCRLVAGVDKIIYWDREKERQSTAVISREDEAELFKHFSRTFEVLDEEEFGRLANDLFLRMRLHFSSSETIRLVNKMTGLFFETCHDLLERYLNEDYIKKQLLFQITQAPTFQKLSGAVIVPIQTAMVQLKEAAQKQSNRPAREAVSYIEEHYGENISLEDVAAAVGITPAYLSHMFKNTTGQNYMDYLTELRLEKAKELLRGSVRSIKEISAAVGYADSHYFSKLFKKETGIKPTEYRKIYG